MKKGLLFRRPPHRKNASKAREIELLIQKLGESTLNRDGFVEMCKDYGEKPDKIVQWTILTMPEKSKKLIMH